MRGTDVMADATTCSLREQKKLRTRDAIHATALRLILDRGLTGVTIEEICDGALVSTRTFFNYFPSKARAAIGFSCSTVPSEASDAFVAGAGTVVSDLCEIVMHAMVLPADWRAVRDLVHLRPEMAPAVLEWMLELRSLVMQVAEQRVDAETAHTAVALVMAALGELAHREPSVDVESRASRLRAVLSDMGELARRL